MREFKKGDIVVPKPGRRRSNNFSFKDVTEMRVDKNKGRAFWDDKFDTLIIRVKRDDGVFIGIADIYANSVMLKPKESVDTYEIF